MQALLLAAGHGTRLAPLTQVVPKCLAPIRGVPLLFIWLEHLLREGFDRIIVNTHYKSDLVTRAVKESEYSPFVTFFFEEELLGTGGTLLANQKELTSADFLLAHADNLTQFSVGDFLKCHRHRPPDCEATMMTFKTDRPSSCGIVEIDRNDVVIGFHEKVANPPGFLANAAIYLFTQSIFQRLRQINRPTIDLSTEIVPSMMGKIVAFHNTQYHRDIGTMESLRQAQHDYAFPFPLRSSTDVKWWKNLLGESDFSHFEKSQL